MVMILVSWGPFYSLALFSLSYLVLSIYYHLFLFPTIDLKITSLNPYVTIKFIGCVIFLKLFILLLGVAYKTPSLRMILLVAHFLLIMSSYNVVGFQKSLEACHIQSPLLSNQFYKLDLGD
jgi:hypothetical protein